MPPIPWNKVELTGEGRVAEGRYASPVQASEDLYDRRTSCTPLTGLPLPPDFVGRALLAVTGNCISFHVPGETTSGAHV